MCSTFAWALTKPDLVGEQLGLPRVGGGVGDAHEEEEGTVAEGVLLRGQVPRGAPAVPVLSWGN